ncbi:MAG: ABC transporter, permease protein 1 (cluster 1, maltose/g3p/polyamine/iron) [uncultured Frankineae bacterium]|uniref:ABC transporter, permease protein 1 (Cluster 1, maltose/g3p/polyamine/iron) n=1 Tax=uncultured Frankineae bacterium TaxID=437475 RepID=A0A6J4KS81_9ACTN|nr:MAG: ABC transporter, permease protein 1 (cluster 1, maltose/g3p/polyamine/iron) [uncultured Frankineae bacterium]
MAARRTGIYGRQGITGWVFTAPMIIVLGLFLFVPILMALYVSMTDWNGNGSPFTGGNADFVGAQNYTSLFTDEGLTRQNFMQSLGNTFYYVLLVVPLQTCTALLLALVVNNKFLKGKGFFRTAFYFPAVTSSIAISTVFLFLFSNTGAVNGFLALLGVDGPQWFSDSRGTLHLLLGVVGIDDPAWAQSEIFGRSLWEWLSGPSVAMCVIVLLAVWTTTGTFMLLFLAALQDLPVEVDEAAALDGVSPWQKLRLVTIPMIKPVIFLVVTLGLIGTWQVFDQIYVMGKGAPAGTTMTPAFLSYQTSFRSLLYGSGAAMAFIVFLIIIALTFLQRRLMAEDRVPRRRRRALATAAAASRGSQLVGAAPQTGGDRP